MTDIYIIGGSNSLITPSWVRQLLHIKDKDLTVHNKSVGAATSLMGIYRILSGDVPPGATVIWEYAVNEANHVAAGQSLESILYHLDWFLELCARRGIRVVPAVFMTLEAQLAYDRHGPSGYWRALLKHLNARGVTPLDFGAHLSEAATRRDLDLRFFFADDAHYAPKTGFLRRIAATCLSAVKTAQVPQKNEEFTDQDLSLVRPIAKAQAKFSNRVLTADLEPIGAPIRIEGKGRVLAAYVIAAQNAGAAQIKIDGRTLGNFALGAPSDDQKPLRLFRHLVLWNRKTDLGKMKSNITFRRPRVIWARPNTQNLFVWNGRRIGDATTAVDPDHAAGVVAVLLETDTKAPAIHSTTP